MISHELDGRAVLLDPSGAELLTLNAVGTLIWRCLVIPMTPAALTEAIRPLLEPAPGADVAADVERFLAELADAGLVTRIPGDQGQTG